MSFTVGRERWRERGEGGRGVGGWSACSGLFTEQLMTPVNMESAEVSLDARGSVGEDGGRVKGSMEGAGRQATLSNTARSVAAARHPCRQPAQPWLLHRPATVLLYISEISWVCCSLEQGRLALLAFKHAGVEQSCFAAAALLSAPPPLSARQAGNLALQDLHCTLPPPSLKVSPCVALRGCR